MHRGGESAKVLLRQRLCLIRGAAPMLTECNPNQFGFAPVGRREVVGNFDGGSSGGRTRFPREGIHHGNSELSGSAPPTSLARQLAGGELIECEMGASARDGRQDASHGLRKPQGAAARSRPPSGRAYSSVTPCWIGKKPSMPATRRAGAAQSGSILLPEACFWAATKRRPAPPSTSFGGRL